MSKKKVSVIVPIYNVEKYLHKCLESIVNQSYDNYEVIMIDDGSTDNSAVIAKGYEDKYWNFRLIRQQNLGLGGARNTGIKYAKGDYVALPDSDDWLNPNYLRILMETAEKYDADVVECNGIQVWDNGATRKRPFHIKKGKVISIEEKEDYLKNVSYVVWNKLFRRELIENIFFPEHMSKQDYAWTPIILSKANTIVLIKDVLYYYLWRSDSATNKKKINYDLLKAQKILESSDEMKNNHPIILRDYFVRNILRTFVWSLIQDGDNMVEVKQVISAAKKKYDFSYSCLKNNNVGGKKLLWEWLTLHEFYVISYAYAKCYHIFSMMCRFIINSKRKLFRF